MAYDRIQELRSQLDESTFHHTLSKVLLSSLKEVVESEVLSCSTSEKIKNILHFGNLNEYLTVLPFGNVILTGEQALLGLFKIPENEQYVKLKSEEMTAVLNELRGTISLKNELVYQTFSRYLQDNSAEATEANLKKLLECLKLAPITPSLLNQDRDISEDIEKCYKEIGKCQGMLERLVDVKLQLGETLFPSVRKVNNLEAEVTLTKSKELLGDIKVEILSNQGAAALEIIHKAQKDVVEMKKLELKRLKEELFQYESLRDDGFERVLDEYLMVVKQRQGKEKLKEEYVAGFDDLKEGISQPNL